MKRIDLPLDKVVEEIGKFYRYDEHHFIVINAVDLGDAIEVQWFFSNYVAPGEVTMFAAKADASQLIPSITRVVPSAWVAEAELVDLMGINIENAKKGFVLEEDFEGAPLRKK
ncbi:MAG: NADH-quinone oxidoreductase subunit C [Bacteroidales bacterium]|nr:NADH-quinone oxidoreductase subunit C [Bacteroidales bacterium]